MRTLLRVKTLVALASLAMGGWAAGADVGSEKSSAPPKDAIVLFDGKDLSGWTKQDGKPAEWKVEDGSMEVVPRKGDIMTKERIGPDFQLHVEFWLPLMANAKGQGRANSGVYLQ